MVGVEEAQPESRGAKQIQFLQIWASSRAILPGSLVRLKLAKLLLALIFSSYTQRLGKTVN